MKRLNSPEMYNETPKSTLGLGLIGLNGIE